MLFIYLVCAISVVHGYDYQRFAQKNCKMEFLQLSEIVQFPVANPEVCVAKCSADSNCEVFVYQHSTRTCYWGSKLEEVVEPPSNNKADFDCYQMKQPVEMLPFNKEKRADQRRTLERTIAPVFSTLPIVITTPLPEQKEALSTEFNVNVVILAAVFCGFVGLLIIGYYLCHVKDDDYSFV